MLTEEFGKRLKYWRLKRGLSLLKLARRMNIQKEAVCHYERGARNPSLHTIEEFLKALNVSIAEFFEEG